MSGTLAVSPEIAHRSLTSRRERLIKIGSKLVRRARYIAFQLAEVALSRQLSGAMLTAVARLRPAAHPP